MKRIITFICAVFISTTLAAQAAPLGKDLVRQFSQKMLSYQTIVFDIDFSVENLQEGFSQSYDGLFKLKGDKYYLELMEMEVYYNGKTKWQFIPDVNEVTISEPIDLDGGFFENPSQIFRDYEQDFKSKFMGEKVEKGTSYYEVDLYPEDLSAPYSILKITFRKSDLQPKSIKYQGKDGLNYLIDIKKFKTDAAIPDSQFEFAQQNHRDVVVVDLR